MAGIHADIANSLGKKTWLGRWHFSNWSINVQDLNKNPNQSFCRTWQGDPKILIGEQKMNLRHLELALWNNEELLKRYHNGTVFHL